MGGSRNGGIPQMIVCHGKSHLEMDDLGGYHGTTISGNLHIPITFPIQYWLVVGPPL